MEPHPGLEAVDEVFLIAVLVINDGALLSHLDQHGITVHPSVEHREILDDLVLYFFDGHFIYLFVFFVHPWFRLASLPPLPQVTLASLAHLGLLKWHLFEVLPP